MKDIEDLELTENQVNALSFAVEASNNSFHKLLLNPVIHEGGIILCLSTIIKIIEEARHHADYHFYENDLNDILNWIQS